MVRIRSEKHDDAKAKWPGNSGPCSTEAHLADGRPQRVRLEMQSTAAWHGASETSPAMPGCDARGTEVGGVLQCHVRSRWYYRLRLLCLHSIGVERRDQGTFIQRACGRIAEPERRADARTLGRHFAFRVMGRGTVACGSPSVAMSRDRASA